MRDEMLKEALAAREHAHAPYSGFKVGACVKSDDGRLFVGCNVENMAYPQGQCAEASAIGAMIAAGGKSVVEVVVVADGEPGVDDALTDVSGLLLDAARREIAAGEKDRVLADGALLLYGSL